ncbi:long-chain-fatty-acid--CoA ligase [Streptomyces stelliscabiei]|uniref:Fatty-acyl-CoA synthase n=2 Tax=Streptomyces stelliscabiei TaxID=146820 RepID=A0A8I0P994_9ACTN|nr:long-chain-fatty-acid--CoA ligase [Streptomyces stelliscabiei]KND40991.1 acyl-CoA synthetase [Streptomyces stelliscabiei]MBE1597573.1 fatty-acyl-CoA synthase [Streptomyces stelliscabiei]MDX2522187.1 long-chain-fatty-acid--CoA ligase [Streptomyces stelliscabiei]MDX2549779.1 long-chain-fatty-acid--CoA ligase [Streptomyces stelliscabiei]MDX2610800.1 long-chain-fatty-acid--CoA ligase [Streptomyces stelliscabiei]
MESTRRTVAQLVADRWDDHRPGLWFEEQILTHHEVAAGAAARAALLADLLPPDAEPHLGVLLDNTPEFPLWLSAAALAGAAVAGINPTRRGPELARDILHTECRLLITERAHLPLLENLDLIGVRVLVTDTQAYADLLAPYADATPDPTRATPADRLLLYFTSGSTGAPKAALCSQGRLAAAGRALVDRFGVRRDDVHYICMPLFHGNAVIADWAPALVAGAGIALRRRFSASRFLDDVRAYGATYFTYVGRAVQYVLATEPRPDDRDHPLRMGFGTEAGAVDAAAFEKRFGVRLVEGYGSSEGGAAIQRTPGAPPGAIGRAAPGDDLAVVDPQTREECPPALLADDGRLLNGSAAIGELVNRGPNPFEGYWRNPEADAARRHDGWYWTGDLFYRDPDGFLYFAGRTDDRLRVDSENLAAAVIENILARYEGAEAVAVYAVPDPVAGDQVMATIAGDFDPDGFAEFLVSQPDLGTKMTPRFVRVVASMPVTATNKIQRATLRREGFRCPDPVWWRPPGKWAYRKFSAVDLARLVTEYRARGREGLLVR